MKSRENNEISSHGGARRLAEELLGAKGEGGRLPAAGPEVERLRHELQVHQIELEMQNEELLAAVETLELARAKYFELYDLAPVGFFTLDEQGAVMEANLAAANMLGVTRGALVRRKLGCFAPRTEQDPPAFPPNRHLENGVSHEWEMRLKRADGAPFWAQLHCVRVQGKGRTLPVYLVTMTVIDERKQFEADLLRDKAMLRCIIDSVGDPIFIRDPKGLFLDCNKAFLACIGVPQPAPTGRGGPGLSPRDGGEADPSFTERLSALGEEGRLEAWVTCLDGGRKLLDTVLTPYFGPDGEKLGVVGISRDVTERVRMEQALQDSEEHFRTLCDAAPVGIFRTDREGRNTYCNPRWADITGIAASNAMGAECIDGVHPDDVEELRRVWSDAMAHGHSVSHEHRRLLPEGKTVWTRVLASPAIDACGAVLFHVGTLEDITELRQARHDLLKNQKLESLGVLAGGIAHDFNNVLTAIFGNVSLARFNLQDPELAARRLEDAEQAIVRASDLTRQLLTFARGGAPVLKVVKVNRFLRETVRFVLTGSNVRCDFGLTEDVWPLEADEGQLAQVVHNLVLNAVQAMPRGGTLTVRTENAVASGSGARFVRISVADTGTGIPEENLERVFDPYFTTKPEGNGLGLATGHSIVKKHGGKIRAESTVGGGTTFVISLPASDREYVSEPEALTGICRGSGLVLVMDDDEDVRAIAGGLLEKLGYSVEMAENGAQAIETYRQAMEQGMPFCAAILDLTIRGGMGGKETIGELLKIDPAVKAVVSSGYSSDPVLANFREYGFHSVLGKPYRIQEMGRVLKKLLEP